MVTLRRDARDRLSDSQEELSPRQSRGCQGRSEPLVMEVCKLEVWVGWVGGGNPKVRRPLGCTAAL